MYSDTKMHSSKPLPRDEHPVIYGTFHNGYIVRSMTNRDAEIVQGWYSNLGFRYHLDIALRAFPEGPGFYIGELDGKVIASTVRVPWDDVYYGSYYYVDAQYRGKGYGTVLRDQVAASHVGDKMLCVDATQGKVERNNQEKFGYVPAFKTCRFQGLAKAKQERKAVFNGLNLKELTEVPFKDLIEFDNKCFIRPNCAARREFLKHWIMIPGGAGCAVISHDGHVTGYGCRRPCLGTQQAHHLVGPLYAENPLVAEAILVRLSEGENIKSISQDIWMPNTAMVDLMEKYKFSQVFELTRMHKNGNPNEFKQTVYALTNTDVCGF